MTRNYVTVTVSINGDFVGDYSHSLNDTIDGDTTPNQEATIIVNLLNEVHRTAERALQLPSSDR